jgi:hypothetical protein
VEALFRDMKSNDDVAMYRTARHVLDGNFEWLEAGIVGLQEIGLPDWTETLESTSREEPAGVGGGSSATD